HLRSSHIHRLLHQFPRSPFSLLPVSLFFFFNDPSTPEIYTLSLHDALPISIAVTSHSFSGVNGDLSLVVGGVGREPHQLVNQNRSEEHTSELQSLTNLVCRLLLEKKKKKKKELIDTTRHDREYTRY